MASVGIGMIVRSAKALRLRGGELVLLNPQPVVKFVLEKTGINTLIPIVHDMPAAREALFRTRTA